MGVFVLALKRAAVLMAAVSGLTAFEACAQEAWPTKPLQLVTSVSAGMTSDIIARLYSDRLSQRLGQPVVVQNRPGAGGTVATAAVAAASPDGYTLLTVNLGHSISLFLYSNLPYDGLKDFAGVALIAESPVVVAVIPQLGVRTLKEFVAMAKSKPNTINYASAGVGTVTHMAGAFFASLTGIEIVHVPYKAMSAIMADVLGGRVEAVFFPPGAIIPQLKEGKMIALGVSATEAIREPTPAPSVKDVLGVDYIFSNWNGIVAPARTPLPVLEKLAAAIREIAQSEDIRERYKALGLIPRVITLREFDAYLKTDMERLGGVTSRSRTGASSSRTSTITA